MKIKVTKQHINEGQVGSETCCPIALALRERFDTEEADVGESYVRVGGCKLFEKTPKRLVTFIKRFDNGHPVKPFVFEL